MADVVAVTDLPARVQQHESVALMVAGANGQAARVAPALADGTAAQLAEARLVLVGAIVRWVTQGAGGTQQQTAGPFSLGIQTNTSGYRLWPSEVDQLRAIVDTSPTGRLVGSIDTAPGLAGYDFSPGSDFFFGPSS